MKTFIDLKAFYRQENVSLPVWTAVSIPCFRFKKFPWEAKCLQGSFNFFYAATKICQFFFFHILLLNHNDQTEVLYSLQTETQQPLGVILQHKRICYPAGNRRPCSARPVWSTGHDTSAHSTEHLQLWSNVEILKRI